MKDEDKYTGWKFVYGKDCDCARFIYLEAGKEVVKFDAKPNEPSS